MKTTMKNHILILTNSGDLHADLMVPLLKEKGAKVFRLNLNEFPKNFEIHQHLTDNSHTATIVHIPTKDSVNFDDISAVWTRKTANFSFISDDLSPQEHNHATQETEHILRGLLLSLDCYWINHPLAVQGAQFKAEQSIRAAKMGFKIPPSLITNKPISVKAFKQQTPGAIITKSMSDPFLGVVFTIS